MKKILIMGLSGSGKTYLAKKLVEKMRENYTVDWYNADEIRRQYNDWDFSKEGRIRQAERMRDLASQSKADYVVADFIAPLKQMRDIFAPDFLIWIDTVTSSKYENTDNIFEPPETYDLRIPHKSEFHTLAYELIVNQRPKYSFDWRKPTVQMLGRWQPWHKGHRALFERLLQKTGQVCIMIRDCQGIDDSNPFDANKVRETIEADLAPEYAGRFVVLIVPNITHIGYGRKVGYTIEQEHFSEEIENISATDIRNKFL